MKHWKRTIGPDASYSFEEIRVTDSTCVTGFGVKAFFIRDKSDLKQGQKVKIWRSDDEIKKAEKIVDYLFEKLYMIGAR
jgi:hypothetical protein